MAEAEGQNVSAGGSQGDSGAGVGAGGEGQGAGIGQGGDGKTPSSLLGGEATAGANGEVKGDVAEWLQALPEDMRTSDVLLKFKDPSELAKAHLDTAAKIAELEGKIPKVPEKADGYTIELPKDLPVDPNFVMTAKDAALKANMSQEQLASMTDWYVTTQKANMAQIDRLIAENNKAQEDALKIEWGSNYETELAEARRAFKDPKLVAQHESEYVLSRYGNDAMLVRIFNRLAKLVVEDTPPSGGAGGITSGSSAPATGGKPKPFDSYAKSMGGKKK